MTDRQSIIAAAETWLACVDTYKNGKLIHERNDPQTNLIRAMLKELKQC